MTEPVNLKEVAIAAFLKEAKPARFAEAVFFKRMINFVIDYGGLTDEDIADLSGVAVSTVTKWKKDVALAPRSLMCRAICRDLKSVLEEVGKGRPKKEVIEEHLA